MIIHLLSFLTRNFNLIDQSSFHHRGNTLVQQNLQQRMPSVLQQGGIPPAQLQQPAYNQMQPQLQPYGSQMGPR